MKNFEGAGYLIGSIVGAIATGVCIYFTESIFSGLLCCICAVVGGQIGKSIERPEKQTKTKIHAACFENRRRILHS